MRGLFIDTQAEGYVADLDDAFVVLGDLAHGYNWLLSNYECSIQYHDKIPSDKDYVWLDGVELACILKEHTMNFIWCVATAYSKEVTLDDVLQHPLPYANDNPSHLQTEITMQNPLSIMEIVSFDSSFLFVIAKSEEIIETFARRYPDSIDLAKHNRQLRLSW